MQDKVFTMEDWTDDFSKNVNVGDLIHSDVVWTMINAVPPVNIDNDCLQVGEAYDTKIDEKTGKWRNTYITFKKVYDEIYDGIDLYRYCGNCFFGENVERGIEIPVV